MGDVRALGARRLVGAILVTSALMAGFAARAAALGVNTNGANPSVKAATVFGGVDTGDLATVWGFEYGTTTDYGNWSTFGTILDGNGTQYVAAYLTGLSPGTQYHYRLVATPASFSVLDSDAQTSSDGTFTTQREQLHLGLAGLLAQHGTVGVALECESARACAGGLVLRTRPVANRRSVTCTQASLSIASWLSQTVALHLSRPCLALLRTNRRHGVAAVLSARLGSGQLGFTSPVVISRR